MVSFSKLFSFSLFASHVIKSINLLELNTSCPCISFLNVEFFSISAFTAVTNSEPVFSFNASIFDNISSFPLKSNPSSSFHSDVAFIIAVK